MERPIAGALVMALVLFSYLNPLLRLGIERASRQARDVGEVGGQDRHDPRLVRPRRMDLEQQVLHALLPRHPNLLWEQLAADPALTVIVRPDRVVAAVEPRCRLPRLPWPIPATAGRGSPVTAHPPAHPDHARPFPSTR